MKLIKLTDDHYIIVDDSEIKEGDYYLRYNQSIMKCTSIKLQFNEALNKEETIISSDGCGDPYERSRNYLKKITHSTKPLEEGTTIHDIEHKRWILIKYIDLQEVKELIGEVDIWQKFKEIDGSCQKGGYEHWLFESGYNQALEDNKEKKYTEEDIRKAINMVRKNWNDEVVNEDEIIQSLQPKTEWEVEFIDGKLKLK